MSEKKQEKGHNSKSFDQINLKLTQIEVHSSTTSQRNHRGDRCIFVSATACGARGRIGSTVVAAGLKRRPRQVVAYGLPLVQDTVTSLSPPGFCLLSPLPFLRYRPVYFSFCCPLLLSLPMWSLG
ncbi:hypothetical protein PoB_004026200 [Plakobranchus ocellatus]|uniref:Uncharacterized protein n=1 Tax=Plakobranchus ocellatus TaxID=259542 RepID=A0AAV4B3P4_9GAST|nr:hypothetical protein PoB_004026200 [Plakobranchus ocellatus]